MRDAAHLRWPLLEVLKAQGGFYWVLAARTPPDGRGAPITRHQLSGGVGGSSSVPREVTSKSEPFVTLLFQEAHLQLARLSTS